MITCNQIISGIAQVFSPHGVFSPPCLSRPPKAAGKFWPIWDSRFGTMGFFPPLFKSRDRTRGEKTCAIPLIASRVKILALLFRVVAHHYEIVSSEQDCFKDSSHDNCIGALLGWRADDCLV